MIKAQSRLVPFWYEPKSEKDAEVKTRFRLRGLSGAQRVELFSEPSHRRVRFILQNGLLGFENLHDHDGQPLDPAKTAVEEIYDLLPDTLVLELTNAITEASAINPEAKKNSS